MAMDKDNAQNIKNPHVSVGFKTEVFCFPRIFIPRFLLQCLNSCLSAQCLLRGAERVGYITQFVWGHKGEDGVSGEGK